MPDTSQLSDAKRRLLERVARGDMPTDAVRAEQPRICVEAASAKPRERIVALRNRGSMPPFFFLHGQWNGDGYYSYPLARDLGPEQPFYAVDPYTFEGLRSPPTLESIGAAHLRSIRRLRPHGPYLLGGFCNGALIAYEIAWQLSRLGERIGLLALVDPMPPTQLALARRAIRSPADLVRFSRDLTFTGAVLAGLVAPIGRRLHLSAERQLDQYVRLIHGYRLLRSADGLLRHRHAMNDSQRDAPTPAPLAADPRRQTSRVQRSARFPDLTAWLAAPGDLRSDYEAVLMWIASSYRPKRYPGKIALLWSQVPDPGHPYWRASWDHLLAGTECGEVETCVVPGTHRSLRSEDVQQLAACLHGCIERALA